MTLSPIEDDSFFRVDQYFYHEQVNQLCAPALRRFNKVIRSYAMFNIVAVMILVAMALFSCLLVALVPGSSLLAITLALVFLTTFSYLIIRMYLQAKKPELFSAIGERYIKRCRSLIEYEEGNPEHHLAMASAMCKFAANLHDNEYTYYVPPSFLSSLAPLMERFSCWMHWKDVFDMKELLLKASIKEHVQLVRLEPSDIEAHAALANAYVMLCGLYADPRSAEGHDAARWICPKSCNEEREKKFEKAASCAIEELQILQDFAPNDPWIHAQLAYSYHDLHMPEKEIHEYEMIVRLRPDDKDSLFKLGLLYFQQGWNAKGLCVYEELRRSHYQKAEQLIQFYGSYNPFSEVTEESEEEVGVLS